jgi:hypothetical protein
MLELVGAAAAASALHYLRKSNPKCNADTTTPSAVTVVAAPQRPSIILFGDSITQFSFNPELCGWGAAMTHWYARQADVVNRGFSGESLAPPAAATISAAVYGEHVHNPCQC